MTLRPDHLLGRDFAFHRATKHGTVRSRVTVAAFDPERGWRLAGWRFAPAWVPDAMFRRLLSAGVLEVA